MYSGRKHDVLFKSTLILKYSPNKSTLNVVDARTGEKSELILIEESDEEEEEEEVFRPRKQGFPPRKYQYEPKNTTIQYASSLEACRADVSIRVDGNDILEWLKTGKTDLVMPDMTVIYPARVNDTNLSYYAQLSNGTLFISNDAPNLTVLPIKNILGYTYEWNDGRNEWTSFSEDVSFAIHDWKTKTLYMHEIVYRYDNTTVFVLTHSRNDGRIISKGRKRSVRHITIRYKAQAYKIQTVF
jgi:hypothetical protein